MKSLVTLCKQLGDFIQLTRLGVCTPPPPNIIIFDVAELGQDVVLTPLVESL